MSRLESVTIEGASGATYDFNIYSADMVFNEVAAVFMIANRDESEDAVGYDMIYLGHSANLPDCLQRHHFRNEWIESGWNVIWVYQERDHAERLIAMADLVSTFNPRIVE